MGSDAKTWIISIAIVAAMTVAIVISGLIYTGYKISHERHVYAKVECKVTEVNP